jgi:hypothetical protein
MAAWSSGWVEIQTTLDFNFTHNLGTTDLVFSVYWYDTAAANTDPISVESTDISDNRYGSRVTMLNDNEVTLSLMSSGFSRGYWKTGNAPAYIKLVLISAVADPEPEPTAAGASWSSGWVDTDGTTAVANGATLSFNHSLGIKDLVFEIFARDANGGTNSVRIDSQDGDAGSNYGAQIQNIETNTFTIQLAQNGIIRSSNNGGTSAIDWDGQQIKILAAAITANEPEAAGTEVIFIEPYDITPVDGAWTKIDAQPAWANSNARTIVVKAETVDNDTGGNTTQYLKARTSAASTIEVDIITHGGTSGQRSVASEQALIPCSEDGSFEYHWSRSSPNGELRSFRVVGYVQRSPFLTGAGDLCKLFPDDSGYQMFRNGLTMQWMSSPAFTTETSQVINFPTPFSAPPLKVTASTRYPSNDGSSQQWFQVAAWDAASVTVRAQSQNVGNWTNPVYADIIAIGIAEVTGCSTGGGGGGGGGDVDGIKVSQLTNAAELKDDDLFLLSRDNEPDGSYDISKNVKISDIAKYVAGAEPPTPTSTFTFIEPVEIYSHSGFVILPWTTKDLSAHIPEGATGCIINITYALSGPDDGIPAQTLLRSKSGNPQYIAIYAGAWSGGDAIGANSQGVYPINAETRSIDISIPVRSPASQTVYLIGYF